MIFDKILGLEEDIARKEQDFVELEFDSCSVAISKKGSGISFNCTKNTFAISPDEVKELLKVIKEIAKIK